MQKLADWCLENNLLLNIGKTKELIIDFRRSQDGDYAPVFINGDRVERVPSIRFLGICGPGKVLCDMNSITQVKKAQQRLFSLRTLKKAGLQQELLVTFYRCSIESIITYCISTW